VCVCVCVLSVCPSVHLSVYQSICPSVHFYVSPSVCLSRCPLVCPFVCMSSCACLSISLSVHVFIYLSVSLSIFSISLNAYLPVYLFFLPVPVYPSVSSSIFTSVHPSVCPLVRLSLHLSFPLSLCVPIHPAHGTNIYVSNFAELKKNCFDDFDEIFRRFLMTSSAAFCCQTPDKATKEGCCYDVTISIKPLFFIVDTADK
jgi:hypothetical protein